MQYCLLHATGAMFLVLADGFEQSTWKIDKLCGRGRRLYSAGAGAGAGAGDGAGAAGKHDTVYSLCRRPWVYLHLASQIVLQISVTAHNLSHSRTQSCRA